MPDQAQAISGFVARIAFYYIGVFALLGVSLPFFPLWLAAKGLDGRAIGLALALPMLIRVFAIPIASALADNRTGLRLVLVVCSLGTACGYTITGFADGLPLIFAAIVLTSIAYTPITPMTDAFALQGLAARPGLYGPVRAIGSAAFIAGNLGAGSLLDVIAPGHLIWVIAGAAAFMALASFGLQDTMPRASGQHRSNASFKDVLGAPHFLIMAIAASSIQSSHVVYYGFSALSWTKAGMSGFNVGMLWAIGVIAEIVLFSLSGRLSGLLTPVVLIAIGAAGAVLRWSYMAFDPPAQALPLLQALHGLSFGATYLGTVQFIARSAPKGLAATAQGLFSVILGCQLAFWTGLSGWLYETFGEGAYAAMALIAGLGFCLTLVMWRRARDGVT